jgi:hypothetical protein
MNDRDARPLLPAMLQGQKTVIGYAGGFVRGQADAESRAFLVQFTVDFHVLRASI